MNKIIALITVAILLITPSITKAQDMPDDIAEAIEENWRILTNQTVIWIGESLDIFIIGSANTTFNMELKMYNNTDHTLYNATYSAWGRTNDNGTAYMDLPDDFTEIHGEYRIQIVKDNLMVAHLNIQVNYEPQRYDELMREKIWDFFGYDPDNLPDYTIHDYIDDSVEIDRFELKKIGEHDLAFMVLFVFNILYVLWTLELQLNYQLYKNNKKGKKTRQKWLLSGGDNSEFFTLGGGIIHGKQPTLPDKINGVELGYTGLVGKNTKEMIMDINNRMGNYKRPKHKMKPTQKLTRKEKKELKQNKDLADKDIVKNKGD